MFEVWPLKLMAWIRQAAGIPPHRITEGFRWMNLKPPWLSEPSGSFQVDSGRCGFQARRASMFLFWGLIVFHWISFIVSMGVVVILTDLFLSQFITEITGMMKWQMLVLGYGKSLDASWSKTQKCPTRRIYGPYVAEVDNHEWTYPLEGHCLVGGLDVWNIFYFSIYWE